MKKITAGIIAHVDSGKTTLSESMLYLSGSIRKAGRVDHGDAFLDNYKLEQERGITIFSKQAELSWKDMSLTLLDTPGHVDFSAEMERTLQVLDYAILVISGTDGVQSHTRTLWRLLARYNIPVFFFINKMDLSTREQSDLLDELKHEFSEACEDFSVTTGDKQFLESIAMCDEAALEEYMQTGNISASGIQNLIKARKLFPCCFGSALKMDGVEAFLNLLAEYTAGTHYEDPFSARVFKISSDEQGNRLTYLKITGGTLSAKQSVMKKDPSSKEVLWQEKANQIRIYSGAKYETATEVSAGTICAVTGLSKTSPGDGLGDTCDAALPVLEPVINYQILLPEEKNVQSAYRELKSLEEEAPELHIEWNEELHEIHIKLMGEVQTGIVQQMIKDRFGFVVEFGPGHIQYKETIASAVEGIGHFEPLRHYAEVHLLLEPGEAGSGLQFEAHCSEDILAKNWQRLILTHLEERDHLGVLTGSPITDMKITLISGRAHLKHTEGGDFRQATYRAVRQGLKKADSVLLEPFYDFTMSLPADCVGRAMTDIQKMSGTTVPPEIHDNSAVLTGSAPVDTMNGYINTLHSYTGGKGTLSCQLGGYRPCHNTDEVLAASDYDSESDLHNPTGSVFCAHGAGFVVPWNEVENYMHLEHAYASDSLDTENWDGYVPVSVPHSAKSVSYQGTLAEDKELNAIFEKTFGPVKRKLTDDYYDRIPKSASAPATGKTTEDYRSKKTAPSVKNYLLVDGYNVIFNWEDLNELSKSSLDAARGRLMDILCNYQGYLGCELILVFDAYKVKGNPGEVQQYHNIYVVYTKEAETADMYIEKTTHEIGQKHHVTVATSDGLEQIIVMGEGASRISSRELKEEIARVCDERLTGFLEQNKL